MRTTRLLVTTAAIASAAAFPTSFAAGQASAVVDRAVAAWANVRSLSGTFEQTVTNPLLRTTGVAHGAYRQQRPNKLAVRFTDPAGDAIVADGEFVWVYLPQAAPNQVRKLPASAQSEVPIDLSQFLDRSADKYDIVAKGAETIGGRPAKALGLTPKTGTRALFTRATVWVDDADGLIHQFEVAENSGIVRRIRLQTLTVNPTLTAADFVFTVPKGAKIVTP